MDENNGKSQLETIAGMVPPTVKKAIEQMAKDDDRTVSQIVRRILEDSPKVKAALAKTAKRGA